MSAGASLFNASLFNATLFGGPAVPAGAVPRQVGTGLLYPALRKAGVTIGPGRTPSPAQFQDSIDELNRLTGTLNCDRLFIFSITRAQYPLTPGQTSYTIGIPSDPFADVDFAAERPQLIQSANILYGSGYGRPLALITDPEWARTSARLIPGMIADGIYNDRAFPVSTLYLTGSPQPGETLELFTWQQVPAFQNVTDEVLLPRQYEDALVLNLAVRLAPHFQRQVDGDVRQQARESLMRLESINAPQPILELPWSCGCGDGWGGFAIGGTGGSGGGSVSGAVGPPGPPGPQGPRGYSVDYAGRVALDGTLYGPPGWTVTHVATGQYKVNHNLGLDPLTYAVTICQASGPTGPIDPAKASGIVPSVREQQANYFYVVMGEGKDLTTFIDAGFNFSLSPELQAGDLIPGPPGPAGTSWTPVQDETLIGVKNGVNQLFTVPHTPVSGTFALFLNGVRQRLTTDYTITGAAVTMVVPPKTTDSLTAAYSY